MRRRSKLVILGTLGVLVTSTLVACGASEPDHAQICYDERTQRRIEDENCDDSTTRGTRWFYLPRGAGAPAVGESVDTSRGSFTRPTTGKVSTVSRGGFGGRGGTGGT